MGEKIDNITHVFSPCLLSIIFPVMRMQLLCQYSVTEGALLSVPRPPIMRVSVE